MDLSLDDIIAKNRAAKRGQSRGRRRRARGGGAGNRSAGIVKPRQMYRRPAQLPDFWEHDMFEEDGGRKTGGRGGAKLTISNLDFAVSDADIEELFGEFGDIVTSSIHYDRSGRSLGTAEVTYKLQSSAIRAFNKYNGVPLDGRSMNIELVGSESQRPAVGGGSPRGNRLRGGRLRRGGVGRGGGGRGGGRGGGGAGARAKPKLSAEELDAQLDQYREKMDDE